MKGQNKDQRPQTQIFQGLAEITDYTVISDEQVDNPVECFMSDHGTLFGYFLVTGHLRVQQDGIRKCTCVLFVCKCSTSNRSNIVLYLLPTATQRRSGSHQGCEVIML